MYIPTTKQFNGKTYKQVGQIYTKYKAKVNSDQLKLEGYLVRTVTVQEDGQKSYVLYAKKK